MNTPLVAIDWMFIIGYCVLALLIGVWFSRRAGKSMQEYFVAGRTLPWWLAGTSIVATSFASDTPLFVSGVVRTQGIWGNWLWWAYAMGGMLCALFFARLWRRARIITDVELIELRYHGRPASALRAFLAVYSGVIINCYVMGWVMLAMVKVADVLLDWHPVTTLAVLTALALTYTVLSGFWGVVATDLLQFIIAMVGSITLAVIVVRHVGGPASLVDQISSRRGTDAGVLDMTPLGGGDPIALTTFIVLLAALWWGNGQGGGYLAQRLFSTKNEKHAVLAMLWFCVAHYVLRPWPWIMVGLASIVVFSNTQLPDGDPEKAYPMMIARFLPDGMRGLMVASFLAAFMSTIDTHLNWGSSYLVNDLYKRFIRPDAEAKHYVLVARIACVVLIVLAACIAWQMESIKGAWQFIMVLGAGSALVGLLRWYWWRVNPWCEISAMIGALVLVNGTWWTRLSRWVGLIDDVTRDDLLWFYGGDMFAVRGLFIIIVCTALWLYVAYRTKPVPADHLEAFYRRVRPAGWWGPIATRCPDLQPPRDTAKRWLAWVSGVVSIYALLFGVGYLCLARITAGLAALAIGTAAAAVCWTGIKRLTNDAPANG